MENKRSKYFACALYLGMLGTTTYALATSKPTLGVSHEAVFKGMQQRYIAEKPTKNKHGVTIREAYNKDRSAGIATGGNKADITGALFATQIKGGDKQSNDMAQFLKNLFPNAAPVGIWLKGAAAQQFLKGLSILLKTGKYASLVSHVIVQGRKIELWTDLSNPDDQVIMITVTPAKGDH